MSLLSRLQLSPFFKPATPSPLIGRLFNPCLPLGVFFLALGFFLITGATTSADVVTIYFPAGLSQNSGFTDKTGSSLLNGYLIRVGTFGSAPSTVASDWVGLTTTGSILAKIEEQFTPYDSFNFSENFLAAGTAFYPPDPEDPVPPAIGANLRGKPIDIVFYNNAVASSASQILIVRMNTALQIDDSDLSAGVFNTGANLGGSRETVFSLTADRVDLLWGFYNSADDVFQTAVLDGGANQITSPLTQTNAVGAVSTYQITANNGADRFFATTNTASANLTLTNLPVGFSIATNTGVITVGTNADASTYSIRLVASNSLTALVATSSLTWVLKRPTLSFTSGPSSINATLGKSITNSNFASTDTNAAYTVTSGKLFGLTLSTTNGVGELYGTPNSVGSNSVWIQATAGTNVGATNFTLVVNPFTLGIAGLTGVLTCTSGVAQTFTVTNSEGYTDLSGELYSVSDISAFRFVNGTNLVISTNTVPQLKGAANISLTLTAFRAVGGTTVSSSTTVPLRIVAPTPTALVGPTEFEVDIGEAFSATILSDIGVYGEMKFSNLPKGLRDFRNGAVTGVADGSTNTNSATQPWEYPVIVVADSSQTYEGGGSYTNTNVIFRLRNTHPPVITSTNRKLGGVGRTFSYGIQTTNSATSYEIIGNLPDGLSLSPSQQNIVGKPKTAGTYPLVLKAYNYSRPGSTNLLDRLQGTANLKLIISGGFPSAATPVASINNMTNGMVHTNTPFITTDGGMRLFAIGLPTGLGLDEYEGVLRGTNQSSGVFPVTLYMMNGNGWTIRQITLTVR